MGGKNVHSGMAETVAEFARSLVSAAAADDLGFGRHLAYFDQSYLSAQN